jgi:hypothetical protein
MAWWLIAIFVVTLVLAYAFMPKPQMQKPPGIGDIQAPTAEVGRVIPVLFGTRDIEGPNVTWWGDVKTKAIKASGGKK